jgi:hypothetical protein
VYVNLGDWLREDALGLVRVEGAPALERGLEQHLNG